MVVSETGKEKPLAASIVAERVTRRVSAGVDPDACNHMTNHKELFSILEKPEQPRVIETGEDTPHPIEHIGDSLCAMSSREE